MTTPALATLDAEVEARAAARLADVILNLFAKRAAISRSILQRVDGVDGPPWWCRKPGWRPCCDKHGERLRRYTVAAIDVHRARKKYDRGFGLAVGQALEDATASCRALRAQYHNAACTCFVDG